MYIHLGQNTVVLEQEIIGIFDLDTTTVSKNSREYLNRAEKAGEVFNVSYELPKSFVVCQKGKGRQTVYISQISSATLQKRTNKQKINLPKEL